MKYSFKRPAFDFYDTVAMECWLCDMAKKGLHYNGNNLAFFRFIKAEPQDICYRVEPTINDEITPCEEMLADYANAGWEFVAHQGNQFFIWRSTRPNATELHTDPIVQSETYLRLCKSLTRTAVISGLCVFGIFAILLGGFIVSDRPITLFLTSPIYILLVVSELFTVGQVIQQARRVLQIKKMLANGFSLSHKKNYRKEYRAYRFINMVSLSLSIVILIIAALSLTSGKRQSIADITEPLPFLPLDLIEQSEEFEWAEPAYIRDGVDYRNYADYTRTPLVPVHYEMYQEGAKQAYKWPDGSGNYLPCASTEYYRLAFSAFAPALFDELMQIHLWEEDYTISEPDAFDRTVIAQNEYMTHLFVRWGKQVIYIRYHGNADLADRLELLAEVLTKE